MSSILNRVANYKGSFTMNSDKAKQIVGVVYLTSGEDHHKNLDYINTCVLNCATRGAKLVCLPDKFAYQPSKTA